MPFTTLVNQTMAPKERRRRPYRPTVPNPGPLLEASNDTIAELYAQRVYPKDIAYLIGKSESFVYRRLRKMNIPLTGTNSAVSPEKLERIMAMYASGASAPETAARYGVSPWLVYAMARRRGIYKRSRQGEQS